MQIKATITINVKKSITKEELQKLIDETGPLDVTDADMFSLSTEYYEILE